MFSNNSIYGSTKSENGKFWYAYEDDPTFISFRQVVNDNCKKNQEKPVPNSSLYRLWYKVAGFTSNWLGEYSDTAAAAIIDSLCQEWFKLTDEETLFRQTRIRLTMLAWLKLKKPAMTGQQFEAWEAHIFYPQYESNREKMERRKERRNVKRRKTERTTDMKKTGRPKGKKSKNTVRTRILELLAKDRSTPAMIAEELNEKPNTVAHTLLGMKRDGEVIALVAGLYTLGTIAPEPTPKPPAKPKKFVRPLNDTNWVAQNTKRWKPKAMPKGASLTCWDCRNGKCEKHGIA